MKHDKQMKMINTVETRLTDEKNENMKYDESIKMKTWKKKETDKQNEQRSNKMKIK